MSNIVPRTAAALALVLSMFAMTACTSSSTPAPSPSATATQNASADETYAKGIETCLNKDGWDVTYDARDNSLTYNGAASQSEQYETAYEACAEPLRGNVQKLSDYSQTQWNDLYEQESKTAECLRDLGVDVPQIPALQTFIERYQTSSPWTSYGFIGSPSESQYYAYLQKCPQPTI